MFLGHYGLAFAAKRASPETSLGTLTFAAQWLDELWPVLLALAGIEKIRIVPGFMAASPIDFTYYPFSHSQLAAIGWGVLIGAIYQALRHAPRAALIVGALVVSHWVLDVIVHAPDLPLFPGGPRVGLGAWNSIPLTSVLEAVVYVEASPCICARPPPPIASGATDSGHTVVQAAKYAAASVGPPPASVTQLAPPAILLCHFLPRAAWVDRHRTVRTP